jgi:hypothetical protein
MRTAYPLIAASSNAPAAIPAHRFGDSRQIVRLMVPPQEIGVARASARARWAGRKTSEL